MNKILLLSEDEIGENLKLVLQSIGVSQAEYAKRTGRTPQAMSSYVNAKQGCFPSNLLQEIVMLGFNGTWYLSGEGDMHQAYKPVDQDLEGQYFERIGRKWGEMVEIFRSVESLVKNKNASKKLQLFDPFLYSNDSLSKPSRHTCAVPAIPTPGASVAVAHSTRLVIP